MSSIYLDRDEEVVLDRAYRIIRGLAQDSREEWEPGPISRALNSIEEVRRIYRLPRS